MNLKEFLHRQQVLSLYRSVMRSINKLPKNEQQEWRSYAAHEFRISANSLEENKYILGTGKRQWANLCQSMGIDVHS